MRYSTLFSSILATSVACVSADPVITSFKNSLTLDASFDPIIAAYWTGLPHHRRTPFSVSPDGKSAYLAYLDATLSTVHVQQVDTTTFAAVGTPFSTAGYEAAGLVAQDDGFALLATVKATGTTDLPPDDTNIISLIRVTSGTESWRTPLNGPGVHSAAGLTDTPDANGDLVYSAASGLYAAYFVVAAYSGDASGHYGDSIQYVNDAGALQDIASASTFGCSHNTGIALEAADAPPFASVCAEDHGSIWLNTETQYMSGVKIANENTTNGVSGEPMGGMGGSYSNLALFPGTTQYIFAWQSRGSVNLYTDSWMGTPYVQSSPRWLNHNVAIATLSSKSTLSGQEASSVVGAAEGDTQVNWITESSTVDHQNVRVATLNSTLSLVSWENLQNPTCEPVPMSCSGTFTGTSFQFVDASGTKVGAESLNADVTVSGDMAVVNGKICWPYVSQTWDLSTAKSKGTGTTSMSFACAGVDGSSAVVASSSASPATSSQAVSSSQAAVVPTSSTIAVSTKTPEVASSSIPEVILSTATVVPIAASTESPASQTSEVSAPETTEIPEYEPATSASDNAGIATSSAEALPTTTEESSPEETDSTPTSIAIPTFVIPTGSMSTIFTRPTGVRPSSGFGLSSGRAYPTAGTGFGWGKDSAFPTGGSGWGWGKGRSGSQKATAEADDDCTNENA